MKLTGYLFIVLLAVLNFPSYGHGTIKKVAILEPIANEKEITPGARLLLKQSLTSAITNTPGYAAYTRSLEEVLGEQKFQRTGLVNDEDIVKIGDMTGVAYVLRVQMAKLDERIVTLTAEILDVKTAEVESSAVEVSYIDADVMVKKCCELTRRLLGKEGFVQRVNMPAKRKLTRQRLGARMATVEETAYGMSGYGVQASGMDYMETIFGINMKMVWVEGGSSLMGCTSEQESGCYDNEKNVRRVSLDGYYIGQCEVTQGQWVKVMGTSIEQQRNKTNPDWQLRGTGDNYPMYYVSWEEAMAFCEELSRRTGKKYRLPTEAQWEYAARGGNRNEEAKYSGSSSVDIVAWYNGNSGQSAHPVATKRDNILGLYDMSGNVWEWCRDWYSEVYDSRDTQNPTGPYNGSNRVIRGGSWFYDARHCRVSYRDFGTPDSRGISIGFRVVCEP